MLTLPDSESDDDDGDFEDELSPSAHVCPNDKLREEAIAEVCRKLSYALYHEFGSLVDANADDEAVVRLPVKAARSLMARLKNLNQHVGAYAAAAVARVNRLQTELLLAQNAMARDVLDREATHTSTLKAITTFELENSPSVAVAATSTAPSATAAAEAATRANTAVGRVSRLMLQMHASTASLTSEPAVGYFTAAECLKRVASVKA